MNRNGQWLVCGPICKDLRKKWFECANLKTLKDARRVERLLRILRESPLASMPVPDAYKKIQAYDQIRRRPGEVIGDYIVREQRAFREVTEALRRVGNIRNEKSGARRHDHQVTSGNSSVYSEAEYEVVEDEDTFAEAPWRHEQTGQTFFEREIRGYRLLQNARLSLSLEKSDRWYWLELETTRSTQQS